MTEFIPASTLTCPECGHKKTETMPTDACQFFYDCEGCGARLKPKPLRQPGVPVGPRALHRDRPGAIDNATRTGAKPSGRGNAQAGALQRHPPADPRGRGESGPRAVLGGRRATGGGGSRR